MTNPPTNIQLFDTFVAAYWIYKAADRAWRRADKDLEDATNGACATFNSAEELSIAQDAVTRTLNIFKAAHNALLKARRDCNAARDDLKGLNLP